MALHDILCANEKKDQSEIRDMECARLVSAVNHCRYLLPFFYEIVDGEQKNLLTLIIADNEKIVNM